jgi:hypothetical protein
MDMTGHIHGHSSRLCHHDVCAHIRLEICRRLCVGRRTDGRGLRETLGNLETDMGTDIMMAEPRGMAMDMTAPQKGRKASTSRSAIMSIGRMLTCRRIELSPVNTSNVAREASASTSPRSLSGRGGFKPVLIPTGPRSSKPVDRSGHPVRNVLDPSSTTSQAASSFSPPRPSQDPAPLPTQPLTQVPALLLDRAMRSCLAPELIV